MDRRNSEYGHLYALRSLKLMGEVFKIQKKSAGFTQNIDAFFLMTSKV